MTNSPHTRRCVVCATTEGPLQAHHIALRAIHNTATVPICPRCHDEQTDRQHQAGLFPAQRLEAGDELTMIGTLTVGITAIVEAHAHRDDDTTDLEDYNTRLRRTILRLLAVISDDLPAVFSPRPVSNDRCRRARPRPPGTKPATGAEALEALAAGLFPALAAAITEALPGDGGLFPGFTAKHLRALCSPGRARNLAQNLAAHEDHPRSGELTSVIKRDGEATLALVEQLTRAIESDGLGEPTEIDIEQLTAAALGFQALAQDWIRFASGLSSAAHPANADAALEKFLDRRAAASSNTTRGSTT